MATGGYLYWTSRHLKDYFYLDGKTWTVHEGFDSIEIAESKESALTVIPTAAGTHVLQKPFYYPYWNRSAGRMMYEFQFDILGFDEEEFYRLKRASARGAAVYFVPFLWVEEVFGATDGDSLLLTRPVAWGIATGCTSGTHPASFFLDDVLDPSCASLTGQTLSALDTGTIAVRYTPAFRVIFTGFSERYDGVNRVVASVSLREVVAFG